MAKATSETSAQQAIVPYLRVKGAADALAFYKNAFGAKVRSKLTMGERIGHAEIEINGGVIMFSDEFPEMEIFGPKTLKGTTVTIMLMVKSCDAAVKKAVAAGAKLTRPATDEFYGDRSAQVEDPFGHVWMLQQRIEAVPLKEMQKRLDAMMAQSGSEPEQKPTESKSK